ncbi:hypothetical protein CRUP_030554, partial [Coryphaenoides rupestris]
HVCGDCKKSFCGRCSVEPQPRHPRLCRTCRQFHGTLFNRTQLMRLKVRELRDYLHLHEVPTDRCREKEELVELVLDQQVRGGASGASSSGGMREAEEEDDEDDEEDDEEEETGEDEEDVEENNEGRPASLSDLSRVEDIQGLSVRQLKEILSRNFVNFMGCCEKWELMERVTRLYNEVRNE